MVYESITHRYMMCLVQDYNIFIPFKADIRIKNEVSAKVEESLYDMELEFLDGVLDTLADDFLGLVG